MASFDDLFNESDEEWIARSRKDIANLPKTKDTRTSAEKVRDQAFRTESAKWAKQRAAAQVAQQESIKRRVETMSPAERQSLRDRYRITDPYR